jgi:hypothetical protein
VARRPRSLWRCRVAVNGIHQWQVTNPDGGTYIDRTPTLAGWKVLVRPSEGASAP